ncbi:substrate-binding domain-containing protein [Neobacillus cucumis]|uniref:substrate-binding domain-containing protein n=1 Tax=Neobacillus cucumis TaxID=1740721 RepID=UPI002853442F|nr:substrate-binding domain-containing protein [Neobacillus cucumis]MDR4945148.1 substrate-binding domain-containing protein [Neobacillus cucumis]
MKKWLFGISIVVVLIAVTGFSLLGFKPVTQSPLKIIIIVKSKDLDFWKQVKSGTDMASKEFHADTKFWAPSSEKNVDEQIELMEKAIQKKPDAIVLAAADFQRLAPLARKAKENGILLLTLDSRLPEHLSEGHIATDNVRAAKKAADYLAHHIGEKGKLAIISTVAGTATAMEREKGFMEAIQEYPDIQVIDIKFSGSDVREAYRLTKQILKEHPDLKGIFGINEFTTLGIAQANKEMGETSAIKTVGFDSSPEILNYVEEGALSATVVQKPFNMGYLAVKQAVSILEGKTKGKLLYTDSVVITKENMDSPENQKLLFPFEEQ